MQQFLSLATDVAGVRDRLSRMFTEEGRKHGNAYEAGPSDVIIATYPKCGTTLMQQIVHGLRTGGDMNFAEITEVVPWLEASFDIGVDLKAQQKAWPRAFKSHQAWEEVPKGARYIYILRDPRDAAVSFYHFFEGWYFEPGSIDISTFVNEFLLAGTKSGKYWSHLNSWWHKRNDADTLMLCFEDITTDLSATVSRVANFIGLVADAETVEIATHQAGIEFMRKHVSKFDDQPIRSARNIICGLPLGAGSSKVRTGNSLGRSELTPELRALYDDIWTAEVTPMTGHADYGSLRAELLHSN